MKLLFSIVLLIGSIASFGQSKVYIRADTLQVYKDGGFAELILRNSTKDSTGLLTNIGNGRTRFLKPRALDDSTILIGLDTVVIRGATGGVAGEDSTYVDYLMQVVEDTILRVDPLKVESIDRHIDTAGSDSYSGRTPYYPKLTINGTESVMTTDAADLGKVTIGLSAGSKFQEQADVVTGARLKTYGLGEQGRTRYATISGMEAHNNGWIPVTGQANLYDKSISHSINTGNPGYHYLLVYEIDTLLEHTNYFAARRLMPLASSLANANSTNGSYYVDALNASTETVSINPSDNADPGSGKYRYEVTVRDFAINGTTSGSVANGGVNRVMVENLIIEPSGTGYGNGFGDSTIIRGNIFNGYGTHAVVFNSGLVENNLFIRGTRGLSQGGIPVVGYQADGTGNYIRYHGNIYLGTEGGPLAHQGEGSNGYIEQVEYLNERVMGDTGYTLSGFSANLAKKVIINGSYAENVDAAWTGVSTEIVIENSVFNGFTKKVSIESPSNIVSKLYAHNSLFKTRGNSNNQTTLSYANVFYGVNSNITLDAQNNIIHAKTDWEGTAAPVKVFSMPTASTRAWYNVIISDVPEGYYTNVISVNRSALGNLSMDYNIYIKIAGQGGFQWIVLNPLLGDPNVFDLATWKTESGMETNSYYMEVDALTDIYIDPENGNYNLNNSAQADTIRMLQAGMLTPWHAFPRRPGVDEAAEALMRGDLYAWEFGRGTAPGTSSGSGEVNTASNVGTGVGIYKEKSGVDLRFKSITDDNTITVVNNTNDLQFKTDTTVIATKWYVDNEIAGVSAGSGWNLTPNTLSATGQLGTASNHSFQFYSNNTERGAVTADGRLLWGVALGTQSTDYLVQIGGGVNLTGTTAFNIGLAQQQTVTAQDNSLPAYARYTNITFNDNGFTSNPHYFEYMTTNTSGTVNLTYFNQHASGEVGFSILGATNTLNFNTTYGVYSQSDYLQLHSANSTGIAFNVGFFDNKMIVEETGARLIAAYLNWGGTAGSGGKGIRENSSALEYQSTDGGGWNTFSGIARLASPTFTGTPAAPTASFGTNTTQLATTAFVQAALAFVTYGTFAPTLSNTTNVTSSSVVTNSGRWTRIGDQIHFAVTVTIETTGSGNTELGITLPVSSAFAAAANANGTASNGTTSATVYADATNDRFLLVFNAAGAGTTTFTITGMYNVIDP